VRLERVYAAKKSCHGCLRFTDCRGRGHIYEVPLPTLSSLVGLRLLVIGVVDPDQSVKS
jgi:hypothetical protein